jgi:hypothetical protein
MALIVVSQNEFKGTDEYRFGGCAVCVFTVIYSAQFVAWWVVPAIAAPAILLAFIVRYLPRAPRRTVRAAAFFNWWAVFVATCVAWKVYTRRDAWRRSLRRAAWHSYPFRMSLSPLPARARRCDSASGDTRNRYPRRDVPRERSSPVPARHPMAKGGRLPAHNLED